MAISQRRLNSNAFPCTSQDLLESSDHVKRLRAHVSQGRYPVCPLEGALRLEMRDKWGMVVLYVYEFTHSLQCVVCEWVNSQAQDPKDSSYLFHQQVNQNNIYLCVTWMQMFQTGLVSVLHQHQNHLLKWIQQHTDLARHLGMVTAHWIQYVVNENANENVWILVNLYLTCQLGTLTWTHHLQIVEKTFIFCYRINKKEWIFLNRWN